jgi:hypothetical protein
VTTDTGLLTWATTRIPARWAHRIARAIGCTDALRVISGNWNDWEDET